MEYFNTLTQAYPLSENDIKRAFPNTSFSIPFVPPENYVHVAETAPPEYSPVIQYAKKLLPQLSPKSSFQYEQQWEIVPRFVEYTDENDVVHTVAEQEAAAIALDTQIKTATLLATYVNALTAHLDTVAQSRNYDNRITCSVRAAYPGPYQAEGAAFGTWMDTVNQLGYQMVANYQAGLIPLPTVEEMIASLPVMVWPS
jgi:hypothetical protein